MTRPSRIRELVTSFLSGKKCETSQPSHKERELELSVRLTIVILRRIKQMSVELDALNANITDLSAKVDVLIAKGAGSVPAASVQAAADAVAAVTSKVVAAS